MLAAEKGADVPAIAVVQTMRVIILTAALPLLLALTGIAPVVAAASCGGDRLAARTGGADRRFGGGGAAAAADQISGELDVRRDDRLKRAARRRTDRGRPAALGARRGAGRHRRADRRALRADEGSRRCSATSMRRSDRLRSPSSFPRSSSRSSLLTTHVRFADIVVAFAPGAMDAMLALALTLHIDPIFVGAHHLSRFVFVTIATPGIVHLFGRPQDDVRRSEAAPASCGARRRRCAPRRRSRPSDSEISTL